MNVPKATRLSMKSSTCQLSRQTRARAAAAQAGGNARLQANPGLNDGVDRSKSRHEFPRRHLCAHASRLRSRTGASRPSLARPPASAVGAPTGGARAALTRPPMSGPTGRQSPRQRCRRPSRQCRPRRARATSGPLGSHAQASRRGNAPTKSTPSVAGRKSPTGAGAHASRAGPDTLGLLARIQMMRPSSGIPPASQRPRGKPRLSAGCRGRAPATYPLFPFQWRSVPPDLLQKTQPAHLGWMLRSLPAQSASALRDRRRRRFSPGAPARGTAAGVLASTRFPASKSHPRRSVRTARVIVDSPPGPIAGGRSYRGASSSGRTSPAKRSSTYLHHGTQNSRARINLNALAVLSQQKTGPVTRDCAGREPGARRTAGARLFRRTGTRAAGGPTLCAPQHPTW